MRRISGWIFDGNWTRVVEYFAALADYNWDAGDDGALEAGIVTTDADLPEDGPGAGGVAVGTTRRRAKDKHHRGDTR